MAKRTPPPSGPPETCGECRFYFATDDATDDDYGVGQCCVSPQRRTAFPCVTMGPRTRQDRTACVKGERP